MNRDPRDPLYLHEPPVLAELEHRADAWTPVYDVDELAVEQAAADSLVRSHERRRYVRERRRAARIVVAAEVGLVVLLAALLFAALYAATGGGPLGSFASP